MSVQVTEVKETSCSSPPREIAPGIWWFPECLVLPVSGRVAHLHTAPYLIMGSEKTALWDGGTPLQWKSVSASLDSLLGERQLDYVIPSHPEVAHCGNVNRLLDKYPEAELVGDIRDYALYYPDYVDRFRSIPAGSDLSLGDRNLTFVDAVIRDLPSSQWAYETTQQVLFVADGFGYSHQPPLNDDDGPVHSPGEVRAASAGLSAEARRACTWRGD
jgi:flavorubredoxin